MSSPDIPVRASIKLTRRAARPGLLPCRMVTSTLSTVHSSSWKILARRIPGKEVMGMLNFMKIKNSAERGSLYIFGDIVDDSWNFGWEDDPSVYPLDIQNLLKDFNGQPIDVHINSGGGHAFAGMAIANMLKQYKGETTAYVDGLAASAASLIAFGCDKIVCPKNAIIMIHDPASVAVGNSQDMLKAAEMLDTLQRACVALYKEKALDGIDDAKIQELMDAESWLTGDQVAELFDAKVEEDTKRS